MGQRGRKSAEALALAETSMALADASRRAGNMEKVSRPDAPYDLTDEQATEWWAVINRMPADWFPRETHGMLSAYCRHVVNNRRVSEMIHALEKQIEEEIKSGEDKFTIMMQASKSMDRLLRMQEREGRALSSLATRMRISQQSTTSQFRQKPVEIDNPWEE